MENFNCWFWFLIFGILLGLVLSWLLGRFFGGQKKDSNDLMRNYELLLASNRKILQDLYKIKRALGLDDPCNDPCDDVWIDNQDSKLILGIDISSSKHLESILGIDTSTANILRTQGINTFFDLAATSESNLLKLIHKAGLNISDTIVNSWPRQAQYIIENDWESLKRLRDELSINNRDRQ